MKGRHEPDRSGYYGKVGIVQPSANLSRQGRGPAMSSRIGAMRGAVTTKRAKLRPVEGQIVGQPGKLASTNTRSGQRRKRR